MLWKEISVQPGPSKQIVNSSILELNAVHPELGAVLDQNEHFVAVQRGFQYSSKEELPGKSSGNLENGNGLVCGEDGTKASGSAETIVLERNAETVVGLLQRWTSKEKESVLIDESVAEEGALMVPLNKAMAEDHSELLSSLRSSSQGKPSDENMQRIIPPAAEPHSSIVHTAKMQIHVINSDLEPKPHFSPLRSSSEKGVKDSPRKRTSLTPKKGKRKSMGESKDTPSEKRPKEGTTCDQVTIDFFNSSKKRISNYFIQI